MRALVLCQQTDISKKPDGLHYHLKNRVDEEADDADGVERHQDAHGTSLITLRGLGLDSWASHGRPHSRNWTRLEQDDIKHLVWFQVTPKNLIRLLETTKL